MRRQLWIPWAVAALALVLVLVSSERHDAGSDAVAVVDPSSGTPTAGSDPQLAATADPGDGSTDAAATPTVVVRQESGDTDAEQTDSTSTDATADPEEQQTPAANATPAVATPAATVTPTPPTPTPEPVSGIEGFRLRVPTLGIDAYMIDLGVDDNGVMEVPLEAQTVAWYRFTSVPGQPGNILLGGHITWHGATAVFRYLEEISNGDEIFIDTPDGETIRYVVRQTWWADPYDVGDVRKVIGSRSGQQSITLFTCGGVWDADAHEYSHRRVVTAYRV